MRLITSTTLLSLLAFTGVAAAADVSTPGGSPGTVVNVTMTDTMAGMDMSSMGLFGMGMPGPDHAASLEPADLQRMVEQGDLDEAKAMASEAEQSLGRLEEEVRGEQWGRPGIGKEATAGDHLGKFTYLWTEES